jgi:hypothetical protein
MREEERGSVKKIVKGGIKVREREFELGFG